MLDDLRTMMWKEWKELVLSRGGLKGGLLATIIIPLGMLGVYIPWQQGEDWVATPLVPVVWSWLPLLLILGMVADSFAGERERKTLETLLASRLSDRAILFGKMAALVSYGWGIALGSLILGTITVNLVHGRGRLLLPGADFVAVIVALGLLTSVLASAAGVLVSLRASSVRQAAHINTLGLFVVILAAAAAGKMMPPEWQARLSVALSGPNLLRTIGLISAGLLLLDSALVAAAIARFRRARLILD